MRGRCGELGAPAWRVDGELLDALAARSGLVCVVGAGGKKTTLYRLAAAHPGRVGVTSTVHIPPLPASLQALTVVAEGAELLPAVIEAATRSRIVAFLRPSEKRGRLAGLPPAEVERIHVAAGFDVTLIKADGARQRWIKAPRADEPCIPEAASTVIAVISARVLGEPLTERIAHRLDRVEAVTGARRGETLTPEHLARLLADPRGALRGVGEALVVPLINMVDDPQREALARAAAERALSLSRRFDRVVLSSMRSPSPLIGVLRR